MNWQAETVANGQPALKGHLTACTIQYHQVTGANEVMTMHTLPSSTRSSVLQGLWQRVQNYRVAALLEPLLNDDTGGRWRLEAILDNVVPFKDDITKRDFIAQTSWSIRLDGTAAAAVIAPGDFALEYPVPLAPNLQVRICVPSEAQGSLL